MSADDVYERVREDFAEDELAHLSLAIVAINGWNRLNVAARTVPGEYVPRNLTTHGARYDRTKRLPHVGRAFRPGPSIRWVRPSSDAQRRTDDPRWPRGRFLRPSFAIAVSFAAESRKRTIVATTSSYLFDALNGAPNF
jgi:hypothetical protein